MWVLDKTSKKWTVSKLVILKEKNIAGIEFGFKKNMNESRDNVHHGEYIVYWFKIQN